jgi:hypothetical protein
VKVGYACVRSLTLAEAISPLQAENFLFFLIE